MPDGHGQTRRQLSQRFCCTLSPLLQQVRGNVQLQTQTAEPHQTHQCTPHPK